MMISMSVKEPNANKVSLACLKAWIAMCDDSIECIAVRVCIFVQCVAFASAWHAMYMCGRMKTACVCACTWCCDSTYVHMHAFMQTLNMRPGTSQIRLSVLQ